MNLTTNDRGFSFVSTLVSVAIMAIVASAFVSMLSSQHREMQGLKQKVASANLNQLLLRVLQNSINCTCHLDSSINTSAPGPLSINTTGSSSHDIDLQIFRAGCDFTSSNNILFQAGEETSNGSGLLVKSVKITNIVSTGTSNEYSGNLTIDYDKKKLVRGLLPTTVALIFSIDPNSGTPATRPIKACSGSNVIVSCANLGGSFVDGSCILPNNADEILSLFKTTSHRIMGATGAGASELSFSCPDGGKILQCSMLLYNTGSNSCGTTITNGDTCGGDGCSGVPGQSWGLDVTCLVPKI